MSKALIRLPQVSSTMSVPSSVITLPLGNHMSSATSATVPSGSTRSSTVGATSAPAMMSNPKFPTYALPSLVHHHAEVVLMTLRSAWVTSEPSDSRRRIRRSRIETTRRWPSGSQPSPDGCPGTSASTFRSDPSSCAE